MLADVVGQLITRQLLPHHLPPIRVVWVAHLRRWFTLDNRRLRVFKNANIDEIKTIECKYTDPEIKREFESKKTNKTIDGGGDIRYKSLSSPYLLNSAKHFDEGTFVFTKKVLSWTFAQLEQPDFRIKHSDPLPDRFNERNHYYGVFPNLILEEARSILQRGLELAEQNKTPMIKSILFRAKMPKKADNPATLYFNCVAENKHADYLVKSADMLLLTNGALRILGMANYLEPAEGKIQICVKIIIDEDTRRIHDKLFNTFNPDKKLWTICVLGSLITQLRMYDVCLAQPQSPFEKQIITGNIHPAQTASPSMYSHLFPGLSFLQSPNTTLPKAWADQLTHLNTSQRNAVEKFVMLDQGLQLIQGPPGTGKTTTIIQLLKLQCEKPDRILLCAPSNKAVHILAERFMKECPQIPMILAGVEEKLPEDSPLQEIFVHTWKKLLQNRLSTMFMNINSLIIPQPENEKSVVIITEQQINNWKNILGLVDKDFDALTKKILLYRLNILQGASNQQAIFQLQIQEYIKLLNSNNEKSFTPNQKWLENQRQNLSILISCLTRVQLLLQGKDDEELELALLNSSKVIFATLSVTGRKTFKDMNAVEVLVIDEAGQAVEAETLIPLQTKPKKCLLVGDTKQLPATVISTHAQALKFDRSLLWRLLEDCKQSYAMLDIQYRMHPEISRWPSLKYYSGKLQNASSITPENYCLLQLKDAPLFLSPYAFLDVKGQETTGTRDSYSFVNHQEAFAIKKLINHLHIKQGIDIAKQVGVITFYKAQEELLSQQLNLLYPGINVRTVDGFQGGESDIIIISFVRANPRGKIGFLNDFRRLNVALTRARFSLLMVGCQQTLIHGEHDVSELIKDVHTRGKIFAFDAIQTQLVEKNKIVNKPAAKQNTSSLDNKSRGDKKVKHKKKTADFNQLPVEKIANKSADTKSETTLLKKPAVPTLLKPHPAPAKALAHPKSAQSPKPNAPKAHRKDLKPPAKAESKAGQAQPHFIHKKPASLYKTQLCLFYNKPGACQAGNNCKYAHGDEELRNTKPAP
jgi:hypothetical protein